MDAQWLRHERIADTEGIGRLANEQIVKADANRSGEDETVLRCECGDDVCHEPLTVTRAVYESVRHDPMLFIVNPGHAIPDAEDVIESGDGFEIVRKHEDVRSAVEASDPRSHG